MYADACWACVEAVGISEETLLGLSYCFFEGSFIANKSTGEVSWVREGDGNCMLDAWVPLPGYNDEHNIPGFRRHPKPTSNSA